MIKIEQMSKFTRDITKVEGDIIDYIFSMINFNSIESLRGFGDEKNLYFFMFHISDFMKAKEYVSQNLYSRMLTYLLKINREYIYLDNKADYVHPFGTTIRSHKLDNSVPRGAIRIEIPARLIEYYKNHKNGQTKVKFVNVDVVKSMKYRSKKTKLVSEYLLQNLDFVKTGECIVSESTLKEKLGVEKGYDRRYNFENFFLNVAVKELQETYAGLTVELYNNKNRVSMVKFSKNGSVSEILKEKKNTKKEVQAQEWIEKRPELTREEAEDRLETIRSIVNPLNEDFAESLEIITDDNLEQFHKDLKKKYQSLSEAIHAEDIADNHTLIIKFEKDVVLKNIHCRKTIRHLAFFIKEYQLLEKVVTEDKKLKSEINAAILNLEKFIYYLGIRTNKNI